ncbi:MULTISPECIES: ABC-F family ATP-binding cassette domain-containing protein [Bacillus]|uniref:Multidrug ABC transporter ATP-binding protein n=2 Tax=Bacillus TaxID=1386 RepID=A0A0M4GD90_9BACI|nr:MULTISPECIES: ABC-F family ATP-binding cassette domain-containing protein [Bacillus]ALC84008.1 multidrug ABC transporter ATP-binding protein [Bacillus gobiensis]MBP1082898.1 ATP-binding cassette subfamily F protein uup [Bacillus capparidis]MED1098119.1 ABC-F family ATP-binding cassette domain-containing protein [Bacillus capparidis]
MSIIKAEGLYKTYGEKTIFDHLSFHIEEKERIGLIGANGSGKSTLLKVIAGFDSTEQGEINKAGQPSIEYLGQEPVFDENETVLAYIFSGNHPIIAAMREYEAAVQMITEHPDDSKIQDRLFSAQEKMDQLDAWDANTAAKTILTKLGITEFSRKVTMLSGGQKKRVAIARALIQPADLLLLDEPTNHLDHETIEWLEMYLSNYSGSILLVTHDRYFLNRVTNRIYELERGQLYTYKGNYEVFLEKRAEREQVAVQSEAKRQNLLRRELAWLRRGAKARSTKQKARIQRVEDLQEQNGPVTTGAVDFAIGSNRLGNQVIEAEDISLSFGSKTIISDFQELVIPGDRIGIIGPNGTGKTTLLNLLAGRLVPDEGSITIGQTVKIGYYTQDHEEMNESLRIIDYVKDTAEIVKTSDGQVITAEQMLERFLFPRSTQRTFIHKLSGGERRRLYLLNVLMGEPNVLFLDEPTNDLDTETLSILEDYLEQFPGVVITVSHDRYFLDRVAERLLVFEEEGTIKNFFGSYSEWLEKSREEKKSISPEAKAQPKQPERKKQKKKLSYNEQIEWDGIEDKIAELESKLEEIGREIAGAGSDYDKIQTLMNEQRAVETSLEEAMDRWTELSLKIEEMNQ